MCKSLRPVSKFNKPMKYNYNLLLIHNTKRNVNCNIHNLKGERSSMKFPCAIEVVSIKQDILTLRYLI